MNPAALGAAVHDLAPHSGIALFLASVICALLGVAVVWARCLFTGSHKHLPLNWVVSIASIAAPAPTWFLLIVMPLDPDLSGTVLHDPIMVALAAIYGLAAVFRDLRGMARQARKRFEKGEPPTES